LASANRTTQQIKSFRKMFLKFAHTPPAFEHDYRKRNQSSNDPERRRSKEMRQEVSRNEVPGNPEHSAHQYDFGWLGGHARLHQIILQFGGPRPLHHQLVHPWNAAHHFVADELQSDSHLATPL